MDELTELEKDLTEVIKKAKYSWLNNESSTLSESEWLAKAAASLCRERERRKNETLGKIRWALSRRETFDIIHEEIDGLLNEAGFHWEPED